MKLFKQTNEARIPFRNSVSALQQEKFQFTNDVMCDLHHTAGIPVGVVSTDDVDFLEDQPMITSIVVGGDVEDTRASIQVSGIGGKLWNTHAVESDRNSYQKFNFI